MAGAGARFFGAGGLSVRSCGERGRGCWDGALSEETVWVRFLLLLAVGGGVALEREVEEVKEACGLWSARPSSAAAAARRSASSVKGSGVVGTSWTAALECVVRVERFLTLAVLRGLVLVARLVIDVFLTAESLRGAGCEDGDAAGTAFSLPLSRAPRVRFGAGTGCEEPRAEFWASRVPDKETVLP